jgi:muramoyltetrapeptide carboxypeptidase
LSDSLRPRLQKGSRVAVVSPASAARGELVTLGCEHLQAFGYEPVLMPHALSRGPLYYAGTREERLSDLHAAFADDTIDGILCTRGGWGSAELLPLLDVAIVRSHPKPFIGYSDHTSLHTWLWNACGMQSFYAPMAAADWSKSQGIDERTWNAAVEASTPWSVGADDGLRRLREGHAEGRLLGGCLSILEAGLGTPWSMKIDEPCILFLEDIGVKPYQWDRMLQHLKFAGLMKNVRGVVFGEMSACVEPGEIELLQAACLHALGEFVGPVAIGLKCGHVAGENRSLPLGAWVKMNGAELSE